MSSRYMYYQPNKKDIKDQYGDCTIRALSKALDCSWADAFKAEIPYCLEYQTSNIFDVPIKQRKEILNKLGFDYAGVSVRDGKRRPTIAEFAKDNPKGTFICNVSHHVVTVVNGKYYDTWDSGRKSLYGYFIKRES